MECSAKNGVMLGIPKKHFAGHVGLGIDGGKWVEGETSDPANNRATTSKSS